MPSTTRDLVHLSLPIVDTDGRNASRSNPCEKDDLHLNLALAMSEKEINETVALLANTENTA